MKNRYKNLTAVPLFGQYKDPYANRRGNSLRRPIESIGEVEPDFLRVFDKNKICFSWLGHSTIFLHMHGLNILVDPIFSKYASPIPVPMLRRFPGRVIKIEELPQIDIILITHNHYDHLDKYTIRNLNSKVRKYIVPAGTGRLMQRFGVAKRKIVELAWYEETEVSGLKIALTPSQHSTARFIHDSNSALWGGYILQDSIHTVYDTGDGGFGAHFHDIRKKYGPIDLAIMECGQYNERWHGLHMFPEESVQAAQIMEAKLAVPVHWGTFVLSDHGWDDPPRRFAMCAEESGLKYRIPVLYEWIEI